MIATKEVCARDIMKTRLLTLHPNDRMEKVEEIFNTYNIRHLPVLVSERIVGLISKSDFLKIKGLSRDSFDAFLTDKIMKIHTVEQYMTSEIVCCQEDTPLSNILDLFLANEIHSLLVVCNKTLLGIITPQDILQYVKDQISDE